MSLTYGEVEKIIAKVPPAERDMPALVVDDNTYTWNEILTEIKKDSDLAKKMLVEIENERKH